MVWQVCLFCDRVEYSFGEFAVTGYAGSLVDVRGVSRNLALAFSGPLGGDGRVMRRPRGGELSDARRGLTGTH